MKVEPIVDLMVELAEEEGRALVEAHGYRALAPAQAIQGELVPHLEQNDLTRAAWQQFQRNPQAHRERLAMAVGLLLGTNVALQQAIEGLYAQFERAAGRQGGTRIDTGGGAYIGGALHTGGGTFVGRDQIVHGDVVHGDKVAGDKVAGDKVVGMTAGEVGELFAGVYGVIEQRAPAAVQPQVRQAVQEIEREVKKGAAADENKLARLLGTLDEMSGDIFEVVASCLSSPWAGVGTVIRKVVARARSEQAGAS